MRAANKVRVIGGRMSEAHQFMQDLFLPPDEYIVAQDVQSFRGLKDGGVILVGTFESRLDYNELMVELEIRKIRILAKIRDW